MNTGRYIRTIILILALFMGAASEAWAISENDIIFDPINPVGGTVSVKTIEHKTTGDDQGWKVTITLTPEAYYHNELSNIIVQKLADLGQAQARRRTPNIASELQVTSAGGNDYQFTIPEGYAGALVNVTFSPNITPGYYVLHNSSKGYLKVGGANVTFSTDETFQSGNLFDKGNSIWYLTSDGYLQNEYFYLNVANNKTLYLSVTPVTKWRTEDIENQTKKHLKINDGTNDLYLCNDNDAITLKASPTNYYNACPVTVDEVSWDTTPYADTFNLTLQSPQLVTYLRAYFKQKINYSFTPDAGEPVAQTDHERRVYATIAYKEGGSGKGTNWDIDASGVLYNKKSSGDAEFTATYNILPADPVAKAAHSTPVTKDIKYKVQQKVNLPSYDANMDYLLYSIPATDDYRYPYDDGSPNDSDHPVKPDGRGGTDTNKPSVLTDPLSDGSGRNPQISWKITVDDEGFYTFQNKSTNKYLYFDETPHASSDYGTLCVGSSPTGNSAKFRLYKTTNNDYVTCYYIIPYSKIFAVYKSDGIANGLYAALNIKDYSSETPAVISLSKPDGNSTWCIYKYEAEYRVKSDFSIKIETTNTADVTGDYKFYSNDCWYGKCIKESPKTGSAQLKMVISGSYKNASQIDYLWTVTGLDSNIDITGGTLTDGTWTKTTTGGTGSGTNRKLVINVPSMPASTISGVIELRLSGYSAPGENVITTPDNGKKTVAFTILGNGAVEWTDISSWPETFNISGAYRLTADLSGSPGVDTFSGILDGNGHTISDLTSPLFTNLTNGTVRNVNLSGVNITHAGPTGAIAGTADGGSRIYNVGVLDGDVGSSNNVCGGIVGLLDGSARVINCFSYANISSGTEKAGIVGHNNYGSSSGDIRTMVMNCMFYGDIATGGTIAPIYGGEEISNEDASKLNNYNYFLYEAPFSKNNTSTNVIITKYNRALAAEERFLVRFEFYRYLVNSTREVAAWYATGSTADAHTKMRKWVLDKSIAPYPILKVQDTYPSTYPSVVNYDPDYSNDESGHKVSRSSITERNKGGYIIKDNTVQTLTISFSMPGTPTGGQGKPTGATIGSGYTINRTDKDYNNFNYNYDKVQLPYYNQYGTGNYTGGKVVTGWMITGMTGGTQGNSFSAADEDDGYNFADRSTYGKDLYTVSGRVFSQGAYFDVPDNVTGITIEPYWGNAAYLSDEYYDCYGYETGNGVSDFGKRYEIGDDKTNRIEGEDKIVYKTINDALANLSGTTVYDNAIVLVGNHHLKGTGTLSKKLFTIMSIDKNRDNEPDYSLIINSGKNEEIPQIRFDFINVPGVAMAHKKTSTTYMGILGNSKPRGWFEVTNTANIRFSQMEYDWQSKTDAPLILLGGVVEQIVSTNMEAKGYSGSDFTKHTQYIHVGSNVWFKMFNNGCHMDKKYPTPHRPISVTGGEYESFYLSGMFRPDADPYSTADGGQNAECYISGGKFGEVAGAGQETIDGNVTWDINYADITNFFGGGINEAHPVAGNITTVIKNSKVTLFCGGPKFGNMASEKTVETTATDCIFGDYYGAGYGGTAIYKYTPSTKEHNKFDKIDYPWNTWVGDAFGYSRGSYDSSMGIAVSFEYEHFEGSNDKTVGRLYVNYASLSLASTNGVTSSLTGCTVENNFYGGGSLGSVNGDITSTLTNCSVTGSAFGAGFSGTPPSLDVYNTGGFTTEPKYNTNTGVFEKGVFPNVVEYTWSEKGSTTNTLTDDDDGHWIHTDVNLANLGTVTGNVTLKIEGNTIVEGYVTKNNVTTQTGGVFGGGDASGVNGDTEVIVNAPSTKTVGGYNANIVYGGGNDAPVSGNTTVNLYNGVINGNVFGGGNNGVVNGSATVNIQDPPTSGNSGSGSGSGGESGGGSGN